MAATRKTHSRSRVHHSAGSLPRRRSAARKKKARSSKHYWSGKVTRESHAMNLKPGVFTGNDPDKVARSVLDSAHRSHTRKASAYASAMSMLNFYINRGGAGLSAAKKRVLERAKESLRRRAGKAKGRAKTTQH